MVEIIDGRPWPGPPGRVAALLTQQAVRPPTAPVYNRGCELEQGHDRHDAASGGAGAAMTITTAS